MKKAILVTALIWAATLTNGAWAEEIDKLELGQIMGVCQVWQEQANFLFDKYTVSELRPVSEYWQDLWKRWGTTMDEFADTCENAFTVGAKM